MQTEPDETPYHPAMTWSVHDLAEALIACLAQHEAALRAEQAVHGLDALDEVDLHPVLAEGLTRAGHAVFRELPYPGQPDLLPPESERERCDLVIAPGHASAVLDHVRLHKEMRRAEGTLFAPIAPRLTHDPNAIAASDAFWLEVKTFGQFSYADGLARPNRTYGSQFTVCTSDVRKLGRARDLVHAALVLVLFSADEAVAEHDLAAFVHRCLDRNLPVKDLVRAHTPIVDRIGNRVCTVAIVPVRCADADYADADT